MDGSLNTGRGFVLATARILPTPEGYVLRPGDLTYTSTDRGFLEDVARDLPADHLPAIVPIRRSCRRAERLAHRRLRGLVAKMNRQDFNV